MSMNPSRTQRPRLRRSLALLALASSLAGLSPRAALAHADTQADTQVDTHAISRSEVAALAATTHRARAGHAALAVDARGLAVEAVAAASGTAVDEPAPVPLRGTVNLNTASASTLELLPGVDRHRQPHRRLPRQAPLRRRLASDARQGRGAQDLQPRAPLPLGHG